jgi:hypothetical protein
VNTAKPSADHVEQPGDYNWRRPSPPRFLSWVKTGIKAMTRSFKVQGKENLDLIPPNARVIIASTHITEMDMLYAMGALVDDLSLIVTRQSFHTTDKRAIAARTGPIIVGEQNFLPIEWSLDAGGKQVPGFKPEDFDKMQQMMAKGKSILMAAHNPCTEHLPDKPGIGASYLAARTPNAVILPVTVDAQVNPAYGRDVIGQLKAIFSRAPVVVTIGKPIIPAPVHELQENQVTQMHGERGAAAIKTLRTQAREVMIALAQPLPEAKRGKYGRDAA